MELKNPIISIILIIFLFVLIGIPGSIITELIKPFIGSAFLNNFEINMTTFLDGISGIVTIIITLLVIYVYNKRCFKKYGFKGLFNSNLRHLIYLIPLIIGLIICLVSGGPIINAGVTLTLICLILTGTGAAFAEETIFRGMMISSLMRTLKSDNKIIITWLLSGFIFALFHIFNILQGANLLATLSQVINCAGMGLLFAAIYLRTGDLWIPIIGHALNNFCAALTTTGPLMTEFTFSLGICIEWTVSIAFLIYGYYLIRSSKRDEITTFWNDRWSKN